MHDRAPRYEYGGWLGVAIIAIIMVFACVGGAFGKTIYNDGGGDLRQYIITTNLVAIEGKRIEIRGRCASACTVYLKYGCVYPNARLQFHAATIKRTGEIDVKATNDMAKYYPKQLRVWFHANAAHLSGVEYAELSGQEAIAMGAKQCVKMRI